MSENRTTTSDSKNKAKEGSLLWTLLGMAGKALVNHLVAKATPAPAAQQAAEDAVYTPGPHAPAATPASFDHLSQAFAIDKERVEETRRHLGDEAAAALERATKEEYARMLRDMQRDSHEAMRETARNLKV